MGDSANSHCIFFSVGPDIVVHLAWSTDARRDRNVVPLALHSMTTSTVNAIMQVPELGCQHVILAGVLNELKVVKIIL